MVDLESFITSLPNCVLDQCIKAVIIPKGREYKYHSFIHLEICQLHFRSRSILAVYILTMASCRRLNLTCRSLGSASSYQEHLQNRDRYLGQQGIYLRFAENHNCLLILVG